MSICLSKATYWVYTSASGGSRVAIDIFVPVTPSPDAVDLCQNVMLSGAEVSYLLSGGLPPAFNTLLFNQTYDGVLLLGAIGIGIGLVISVIRKFRS